MVQRVPHLERTPAPRRATDTRLGEKSAGGPALRRLDTGTKLAVKTRRGRIARRADHQGEWDQRLPSVTVLRANNSLAPLVARAVFRHGQLFDNREYHRVGGLLLLGMGWKFLAAVRCRQRQRMRHG